MTVPTYGNDFLTPRGIILPRISSQYIGTRLTGALIDSRDKRVTRYRQNTTPDKFLAKNIRN